MSLQSLSLTQRRSRSAGFSLIELMIVVGVVAILAAVAYPNYTDHVRKSKRAQAKADLVEYAQNAERYFTVNNTYAGMTFPGGATTLNSPREGGTAAYALTMQRTQSSFTLIATPQGNQLKDKCGTLTLDQAGRKTPAEATVSGCW